MDWVFEVTCVGEPGRGPDARAWANVGARGWAGLPGLTTIDLYAPFPDGARDPFNDDGPGPLFIGIAAFARRDALKAAVENAPFASGFAAGPAGLAFTVSSFERHFYPVGQEITPWPSRAPFSYVVRYHKPAEDETAFIQNYVDTHPPTLAKLPGIRSVMCYFPLPFAAKDLTAADYLIGNEVVFDDVAAFNAAMQSPVRQELRRHFHAFPKFSGRNTHYPMMRRRLVG